MKIFKSTILAILTLNILLMFSWNEVKAQIVPVGSGSYTTTFPGTDIAGRNTFPTGSPLVSGAAVGKPIPTNDWWSTKIKSDHVSNMFNYPLALKTTNQGLVVSYIEPASGPNGSSQPFDDMEPIIVGVDQLNAPASTVSDYSDFTVSINWQNGLHTFTSTIGIAMPFIYFTKHSNDIAKIIVNNGNVTVDGEIIIIEDARQGADFAIYAPEGSVWTSTGNVYTSDLNNKDYWSMAYLPPDVSSYPDVAAAYQKYAFVFPSNTSTSWTYDENTAVLRTRINVKTEIKEGSDTLTLLGLLPHQWANLADDSPKPEGYTYPSIRGEIKTIATNSFFVENTFHGILPTLPYLNNYSEGFSPSSLNQKVRALENDGLSTWTDSYNEGQVMNRLIQTARIADLTGNSEARDKMLATIKERLEDWLIAEIDEIAFLFYYNSTWTALIGYPAGHGQDGNLNDHHFHWGYFIHAAAFLEQYQPGWADQWGEMINYLVRDAASPDRNDPLFPFLRNFSPYAGHCWANGFASFPFGNDQESTSESMQFNSSLIHWGSITGNDEIRDLGIYLYTTEQTAIEEYWFDMNERTFKDGYGYSVASRIWGNGYDNQTFWTSDIAAVYGIEMYPVHGGSLYLGHDSAYAAHLWQEITQNTGILENEANPNLWHDIMWQYLAFTDAPAAIELYNSYPERSLKFGISDAQTYYWLHSMNALGLVDTSVTADYPITAVFTKDGEKTYTAHNYTDQALTVHFSDGYTLEVAAASFATSKDISISGELTPGFYEAYPGGSIDLDVKINGGSATKVVFYNGDVMMGEISSAPYTLKAENLPPGKHDFLARVYLDTAFNITNIATVIVGRQIPYSGTAAIIPGEIEAGHYDIFEGGNGQGIAYSDVSQSNEGDFRPDESVDASLDNNEGAIVKNIASGEWLEYSIFVSDAGLYTLDFRYASDSDNGGGPFQFSLDGKLIGDPVTVNSTGDWDDWSTKTVNDIPMSEGEHVLRITFSRGELNLGKMTFAYSAALPYNQPKADAGDNILVILPENTATLDGSASSDPGSEDLGYLWTQNYGPSVIAFEDSSKAICNVSGLVEGVYSISLKVENSSYSDEDNLFLIVSETGELAPSVKINSPGENADFIEGKTFFISAIASDLDGSVAQVDFYVDDTLVGTSTNAPYSIEHSIPYVGSHTIHAVATDDASNTASSEVVNITISEAPPCRGTTSSGDFDFEFSDDVNNPSLTFIPSQSGVGNPTCILYYSTNPGNTFPGYGVTPNVPFPLSASEGETVYFYYVYTFPGAGDRNNADAKDSYVIGTCVDTTTTDTSTNNSSLLNIANPLLSYYPNPVSEKLYLNFTESENDLKIYDLGGRLLDNVKAHGESLEYDMQQLGEGLYFVEVRNRKSIKVIKILKR